MEKTCKRCGETKPREEFTPRQSMCKICFAEYQRDRYERGREAERQRRKELWAAKRLKVFEHYGKVCAHCGFADLRALSIDHVHGGGSKHRQEIGKGNLYPWLLQNGLPPGYQTLCMNCNFIKRHTECGYFG